MPPTFWFEGTESATHFLVDSADGGETTDARFRLNRSQVGKTDSKNERRTDPIVAGQPLNYPTTRDGRYFVHKKRLWRCTNPSLDVETRQRLVSELMNARRQVAAAKRADEEAALTAARQKVHAAKVALGERGPTWWDDGTDYNRHLINNIPYADWWSSREE